jgi:hypothetical protein
MPALLWAVVHGLLCFDGRSLIAAMQVLSCPVVQLFPEIVAINCSESRGSRAYPVAWTNNKMDTRHPR